MLLSCNKKSPAVDISPGKGMSVLFFQASEVFFRFQTGNTAGTGGNNGLTELRIFNIAGGKKAGNAGCAAFWFGDDVSFVV